MHCVRRKSIENAVPTVWLVEQGEPTQACKHTCTGKRTKATPVRGKNQGKKGDASKEAMKVIKELRGQTGTRQRETFAHNALLDLAGGPRKAENRCVWNPHEPVEAQDVEVEEEGQEDENRGRDDGPQ